MPADSVAAILCVEVQELLKTDCAKEKFAVMLGGVDQLIMTSAKFAAPHPRVAVKLVMLDIVLLHDVMGAMKNIIIKRLRENAL